MALETGTYINDLVATNPTAFDPKAQGDDHLRLVKTVLKNSFAGFTGIILGAGTEAQGATVNDYTITLSPAPAAYTANTILAFKATHTNTGACTLQIGALGTKTFLGVDGAALSAGDITTGEFVTAIYDGTQFYLLSGNDRGARDGETWLGTHNFTGATLIAPGKVDVTSGTAADLTLTGNPVAPTPTLSNGVVNKSYADGLAFATALPAQTGNAGKYITTNGATASWAFVNVHNRAARTSNTILDVADTGKYIDITSGTFTQTFTAAATLGADWSIILGNSGTGDITLDPNGAELIDGLATFVMYPGEVRLITCTGAAFISRVLNSFYRVFTASGTFTRPPGYAAFSGLQWAAGGGGGKTGVLGNFHASGGGGGACLPFLRPFANVSASASITIGAGGAGATAANTAGVVGGNTIFDGVTVYGGGGGWGDSLNGGASSAGGGGGGGSQSVGVASSWNNRGAPGGPTDYNGMSGAAGRGLEGAAGGTHSNWGGAGGKNDGNNGGNSIYGGAGGGGSVNGVPYAGGTSVWGGNGGTGNLSTSGSDGVAPGGGGGGTQTGTAGTGARGELRIWGVC